MTSDKDDKIPPAAEAERAGAWDAWVVAALPGAVAYAASLAGGRSDGEDIVQDCVCRLILHADRYDLERDGRKLLFRSITNACLNLKRRRRRMESPYPQRGEDEAAWDVEDLSAPSPPAEVLTEELRSAIAEGLAQLPLRYRAAIELTIMGYKPREIAETLEVGGAHVRVILARARKSLSAFLESRFPA